MVRFTNGICCAMIQSTREHIRKERRYMALNLLLAGIGVVLLIVGIASRVAK